MLKIPGYETLEKIHEGTKTLIYRGKARADGRPVVFKAINSAYPAPEVISRLKREFEITARFQKGGVINALELVSVQNSPVIILEDFGGLALTKILGPEALGVEQFLSLAVRLAEILSEIHGQGIIHKDINPANIVWNQTEDIVKIIDFGISLELSREETGIKNPNVLEGTLAYISPEQTGRMNRFLDYRTDYYSLGVSFFRMLAGRLPFESTDAMEMVYAHIARQAPMLHVLDENIPRAVSDIVYKLMAKNVEDRYQSAKGLAADLRRCRDELRESGRVSEFLPGLADVSNRFQIPQKLFGREDEVAALLTAFERASQGDSELMLVSGRPGIGKSALVNELQKPIVKLRGNFISGKYDKFEQDVPYSALLHAFSRLVKHLLAENEERLADWRRKILQALGPNGRVITDVIPELELVIGKQPEIPELGPEEARNRFNLYFQFFMDVFCKAEHPLVLFLDDLQWADHASLEMIKLFLSDSDVRFLFVIGAFRSNEVDDAHPLNLVLDDIRKTGTGVNSTAITPLTIQAITELLWESLHCDAITTAPLAELLLRKTGGNPFFLSEFLKTLYQNQLLSFKSNSGWSWDVQEIKALQVTDNVVDLMAAKIESLPEDCRELIKLGACFGNYFKSDTLGELTGKSPEDIQSSLNILLEEDLVIKQSNYKFAHDRIQEAAYGLLSEEQRVKEHHRIGRMELERTEADKLPLKLFYIVNQLNAAREMIDSEEERLELLHLNLQAGRKARASGAYRSGLNFLDVAAGLLGSDPWVNLYSLTLSVFQERAFAAYLCGDYKDMDALADTVIERARDVLDSIRVYEAKILAAMARNELLKAVQLGIMVIRKLGVGLPTNPSKLHVLLGLLSAKWTLWGKSIQDQADRTELNDPRQLAVERIMSGIGSSAYIAMPNLLPLIAFYVVKLSVKKGNSEFSPYSFAGFGYIHCGVLGDMETGYDFGQLALRLMEKPNFQVSRVRTLFVMQFFIKAWKEHLRKTLEPLKEALRLGMETGDPEFTCHAANSYVLYSFYSGCELAELEKESAQFRAMIGKLNQLFPLYQSSMDHQIILNLLGMADLNWILKGKSYDIDEMLLVHARDGDKNDIFAAHLHSCFLNYTFGRYEQALEHADLAKPNLDGMMSTFYIVIFNFYHSLSLLALYSQADKSRKRKYLRIVSKNQKKMKHWAAHAPMNSLHKFQLVEAELARVQGRELKARDFYEEAIQGARDNHFINEEALALELFAKFWADLGKDDIASLYMTKARQAYGSWGAQAKVFHLEENFPRLIQNISFNQDGLEDTTGTRHAATRVTTTTEHETTGSSPSGKLDLETVMKSSQAISGEIMLGNLLRTMIKIVMENAGARTGFLILENKDKLYVEAAGDLETDEVIVLQSVPLEYCEGLSVAVVQYAARTRENVVLQDASNAGPFTGDAHITAHKPKSILCSPILNQGKLSAILYLENNLSTGAFTADRLKILNMLSSQIAVSIDNARLYANLEEKVQERTAQLSDTLVQVQERTDELGVTLDQVRTLKIKQDGDYFLTSMLINPLARNEVKSERVSVNFLVVQKKQFKFEKWEEELGGDMCIAHSIQLENTTHTVFLNADAMGKSMQGAGGILVLGAVFQSIMERTRLDSFDESQNAEEWLKGAFWELQKVFESFDGSMLISLVLGTVNDGTGELQMLNAEHPWTVLFRDGKPAFIEEEISLYKLGAAEQKNPVHIYRTQLIPGDVIIAGSDGRDDILLPNDDEDDEGGSGGRNINSDETQFLARVVEAEGNLEGIYAGLLKQGELIDDLSLLRLEYR